MKSFVVTGISGGSIDMSSLQGAYSQNISVTTSGSQCASLNLLSGSTTATFNLTTSGNSATVMGYTPFDACQYSLTYVSGNSTSGFNPNGFAACSSGISSNSIAVTNLRKLGNLLKGTITASYLGCTQTATL